MIVSTMATYVPQPMPLPQPGFAPDDQAPWLLHTPGPIPPVDDDEDDDDKDDRRGGGSGGNIDPDDEDEVDDDDDEDDDADKHWARAFGAGYML